VKSVKLSGVGGKTISTVAFFVMYFLLSIEIRSSEKYNLSIANKQLLTVSVKQQFIIFIIDL